MDGFIPIDPHEATPQTWSSAVQLKRSAAENRILSLLPKHELRHVMQYAERVALKPRQVLQERGVPLRYAYFIENGLASLQSRRGQGASLEVLLLGRADFVGIAAVLGAERSPRRCLVHVGGHASRIPCNELCALVESCPKLREVLLAYAYTALNHMAQVCTCNTCHTVTERVVRWLLLASDQVGSRDLKVTHSCIARALGIRRASVTDVVRVLERLSLVGQARGMISLLRTGELEQHACSCARAIREAYRWMDGRADQSASRSLAA